ncbi:MAG: hypothetical protein JXR95_06420 [Deltaproteobacteria bacterium]|nr:hypothetical protein [Deltaproteobacteria bacterium]
MKQLYALFMLLVLLGCDDSSETEKFNSSNNTFNNATNNSTSTNNTVNNITNNTTNNSQLAIITGRVWSPGADDISIKTNNQFPVPGALVALYTSGVDAPQDGNYCNECVELPEGVPHVFTDVDGYFEIHVAPNVNFNLLVQKGEFRRVTQITSPSSGELIDLDAPDGMPTNSALTLPNHHDPENGTWTPRIAIVVGAYEKNMNVMFEALGFEYDNDRLVEIDTSGDIMHPFDPTEADLLVEDPDELAKYNLIIVTCGGTINGLFDSTERNNLVNWVKNGGKLYVDDFSYDWVEQAWPEFLTYYVSSPEDEYGTTGVCGDSGSSSSGECNNWSEYSSAGYSDDDGLNDWLALYEVNRGSAIQLEAAWDIIHEISPGPVGECPEGAPNCQNDVYYLPPKVWMRGNAPDNHDNAPMTVSWNHYCGKVLYTVYHTHSEGYSDDPKEYDLLIQEKIMMYLIMEIQTCTKPYIVE